MSSISKMQKLEPYLKIHRISCLINKNFLSEASLSAQYSGSVLKEVLILTGKITKNAELRI